MSEHARAFACALAITMITATHSGQGLLSSSLTAAPSLTDLRGVDDLKSLFNKDVGRVRLVLLVSPT
jgi:hypothetical protein